MKHLLMLEVLGVSVILTAFCSGCCSCMVWQETGKVTTHVEETRADFTRPGELTLRMTGWKETAYLPWWPVGHEPWEETVTLPLDRLPDREIGFPEEDEITVGTHMKKYRFHKTESGLWSMAEYQYGYVHPDDISHLSEPYICYPGGGEDRWLMIPLEVRETNEEQGKCRTVHVKSYWAHTVQFPGDQDVQDMEGVGITIWKCCLLPIPIVLDAATFPIQAVLWFGFMCNGPCGGGLLTD